MAEVVHRVRVGSINIIFRSFAANIAGLFLQFTLCGIQGLFTLFAAAGGDFGTYLVYAVAILLLDDNVAFFRDGDDIHPRGIFHHIEVGDINAKVGKDTVFTDSEERFPRKVLTG